VEIVHRSEAKEFKKSDICTFIEYSLGDSDINGAVFKLNSGHPTIRIITFLK